MHLNISIKQEHCKDCSHGIARHWNDKSSPVCRYDCTKSVNVIKPNDTIINEKCFLYMKRKWWNFWI